MIDDLQDDHLVKLANQVVNMMIRPQMGGETGGDSGEGFYMALLIDI